LCWLGFTAVVALDLAATPPVVPIPPLNQKVLEFARERIGEKVADGQCISWRSRPCDTPARSVTRSTRAEIFVWGRPVASFNEALPGDISSSAMPCSRANAGSRNGVGFSWHHEYPHHTAIVLEVREGGRVVAILHQNVGRAEAADATKQVVQEASIRPESLQDGGAVAIYRPVARDEVENPEIRYDGPIARRTEVAIRGDSFLINGRPTYEGRSWKGRSIEGLLFNSRMVQGIFDDLNPETRSRLGLPPIPSCGTPERNTREFLAAMPLWRDHGLLAFTINLQGGSPQGYSKGRQTWHNSAITAECDLRPNTSTGSPAFPRPRRQAGMAVILGLFYFGQDERLKDEAAVVRAVDRATDWILDCGYKNVLIEVNNECNIAYDHAILKPDRVHELIERVKARRRDRPPTPGRYELRRWDRARRERRSRLRLPAHARHGVRDPGRIAAMVREARAGAGLSAHAHPVQ